MNVLISSTDLNRFKYTDENVIKLREHFPHLDDETLARYLIAQNNDIAGAVTKLQKAEALKAEYWHIKKSQCINEIKKGVAYLHGTDREGRPLLVLNARLHDPINRNLREMVLMTLWWTELAISRIPEGKSQFVILLDRDNCENAVDTEYMQKLAEIFQDLHPERLHKAIVYPTGLVYYSMWNLVLKWFMDEQTRGKVLPAINLSDVFDLVEERFIPVSLGGKSTYEFNAEDFNDPVYKEDVVNSPSNTTLESACSTGERGRERSSTGEVSADHNPSPQPSLAGIPPFVPMVRDESLLEFEEEFSIEDIGQIPVTPPRSLPSDHCLRVLAAQLLEKSNKNKASTATCALDAPAPIVLPINSGEVEGDGWQEFLEYERSQHNSPRDCPSSSSAKKSNSVTPISRRSKTNLSEYGVSEELFSPDTVYGVDDDCCCSNDEEEEDDEGVWNDVDSIKSRVSSNRNQYPAARSNSIPCLSRADSTIIPAMDATRDSEIATIGSFSTDYIESYHYNITNNSQVRTFTFPPMALSGISAPIASAEGDGDDLCEMCWHEVASVDSDVAGSGGSQNDYEGRALRGTSTPGSRHSASSPSLREFGSQQRSSSSMPRSRSAPALLPVPDLHSTTTAAYARLGMYVVFASLAVVVVSTVLYAVVSPQSLSIPFTLLAQLMLLLMLLFSFV